MFRFLIGFLLLFGITFDTGALAENSNKITVAVFGDWPYSPNLLKNSSLLVNSINADRDVRHVIFVGDIHSGTTPCTGIGLNPTPAGADPGWNKMIFDIFESFESSVVYTPGDDEWADCAKTDEFASGYPLNELDSIRSLFFARPGHALGKSAGTVSTQAIDFSPLHPEDSRFVENAMWEEQGVIFVTLNMPGTNNDTVPWTNGFENALAQTKEVDDRNAANLHWLETAFARAQKNNAPAIVIAMHADMWESEYGVSAYAPFVQYLAAQALSFKRPVLLINGDSHKFKQDQPLADPRSKTGSIHRTPPVPNLTRISVQGSINSPAVWLRLIINPTDPVTFDAVNVMYCRNPGSTDCQ